MPEKTTTYTTPDGRTFTITYERSKLVTTAIEYLYDITSGERRWTCQYGISQTAAGTRKGATLIATLGERGLKYVCDALARGVEVPFRAIEQKDGSIYFKKIVTQNVVTRLAGEWQQ
jgi:hypothetical protein